MTETNLLFWFTVLDLAGPCWTVVTCITQQSSTSETETCSALLMVCLAPPIPGAKTRHDKHTSWYSPSWTEYD